MAYTINQKILVNMLLHGELKKRLENGESLADFFDPDTDENELFLKQKLLELRLVLQTELNNLEAQKNVRETQLNNRIALIDQVLAKLT